MDTNQKENNSDTFEPNQDQIIADAAKNIVNQQGQLFPNSEPQIVQNPNPGPNNAVEPMVSAQNIANLPEFQQQTTQEPSFANFVNTQDNPQITQPKKSFLSKIPSKRKNILFVFAGLLIFAGLLVGLVLTTNAVFNKPQTVVAKSIMNSTKADYFNAIKTNINVTNSDGTSVSFYAVGGQKDSVSRADFNLRYAVFNIDGSFLYDKKQESTYFKVNGLSDLAKALGAPVNLDQNLDSWVKLAKEDLSGAGQAVGIQNQPSAINPMLCVESMSKYIQTDEFRSKMSEAYQNNQFADVKKVGNETVDNQKAGKYSVAVNSESFDLFMADLGNNALKPKLSAIDPSCNVSSENQVESTSSDVQIKNVYIWVNSKKQLLQIAGELDSGNTKATIQLNMVNDSKLDYSIPSSSVSSLEQLFGI